MYDLLQQWLSDHGMLGIVVFLAAENLGVPWPTTLAYIVAIDLVRVTKLTWAEAALLCTLGHVLGALVGYGLGRAGDNALLRRAARGGHLQRTTEWLHTWFARYGSLTVFAARLIGQVRPWASLAAGVGGIGWRPYVLWSTLGSLIHVLLALWLAEVGWWFWDAYPGLRLELLVALAVVFWGAFVVALVRNLITRRSRTAGGKAAA